MMFVNEDYKNYNYVVGISDNYVVLAKQSIVNADWQNPKTIDVIYQYLKPSFITIEATRTFNQYTEFTSIDENSQSFFARADSLDLIEVQVILTFMLLFFLNGLTRFVKKGGVFFGN